MIFSTPKQKRVLKNILPVIIILLVGTQKLDLWQCHDRETSMDVPYRTKNEIPGPQTYQPQGLLLKKTQAPVRAHVWAGWILCILPSFSRNLLLLLSDHRSLLKQEDGGGMSRWKKVLKLKVGTQLLQIMVFLRCLWRSEAIFQRNQQLCLLISGWLRKSTFFLNHGGFFFPF